MNEEDHHAIDVSTAVQRAALERVIEDLKALNALVIDKYVLTIVFEGHKNYIDQRLKPLERIVYGLVGIMLSMIIAAMMYLVLGK